MSLEQVHLNQDPALWNDGLIPREWWMPGMYGKRIDTPTDELGRVDADLLFEGVKRFIRPEFPWVQARGRDRHHLHHIHARYASIQEKSRGEIPALAYCESAINIVQTVRLFHTLIHVTTFEPPIPHADVMRHTVDAQRAASGLYSSVCEAIRIEREERRKQGLSEPPELALTFEELRLGRIFTYAITDRHFDGISDWLQELEGIPQEFWPFSASDPLHASMAQIGNVFRCGYQTRVRAVQRVSGWAERQLVRQRRAHDDMSADAAA